MADEIYGFRIDNVDYDFVDQQTQSIIEQDAYNSSTNYVAGDWFIYNNVLYKVKTNCIGITPPNATYYETHTITDLFDTVNSNIATINSELVDLDTITITTNLTAKVKRGNLIISCLGVVPSAVGSWVSIGTITDSRYFPSQSVYTLGFQRPDGSTITPVAVYITSAGNILVNVPSTGSTSATVAFSAIIPI